MTECYYVLLGIAKAESTFDNSRIGDQGRSLGPFQIQYKLHNITKEQAFDYGFAAEWTIDRMVRDYSFPSSYTFTYAIQAHNGIVMKSSGHMKKDYALAVIATANQYKKLGL
jgi:NhaP-type Na+/H+ and K+/H+ antiporter